MKKVLLSLAGIVLSIALFAAPATLSIGWTEYPPFQISATSGLDIELAQATAAFIARRAGCWSPAKGDPVLSATGQTIPVPPGRGLGGRGWSAFGGRRGSGYGRGLHLPQNRS